MKSVAAVLLLAPTDAYQPTMGLGSFATRVVTKPFRVMGGFMGGGKQGATPAMDVILFKVSTFLFFFLLQYPTSFDAADFLEAKPYYDQSNIPVNTYKAKVRL